MTHSVAKEAMRVKLADEQQLLRELRTRRNYMRRKILLTLGKKSRPGQRLLENLRNQAQKEKETLKKKFERKLEHLRKKKLDRRDIDEDLKPPDDIKEFEGLSVFTRNEFESIVTKGYDIKVIGDIELDEKEKAVLKLHQKFAVLENLRKGGLESEQEASLAKVRIEIEKESEDEGYSEEDMDRMNEIEAESRQVFDPVMKEYDARKRRVTDLKECARVTLPRPLSPEDEAKLDLRKRTQEGIYEKFRKENTNNKDEQKSNLTKDEEAGLKSLLKRISDEELVIMKTDKSSRFVVTDRDNYLRMGEVHTRKDREVDSGEAVSYTHLTLPTILLV